MRFAEATLIGEAYEGTPPNEAHPNVVLGRKGTVFEGAWVSALASPRPGHIPFLVCLRPNLPVKPLAVFVNKAELRGDQHSTMTWGPAQAGVARGIATAVREGVIPAEDVDDLLLLAAVYVPWGASDTGQIYENNFRATLGALRAAVEGRPALEDILGVRDAPKNPFFDPDRAD